MVKGISRQVIVLNATDTQMFEQAIFIIKDEALRTGGVTDDVLMKEAKRLLSESAGGRRSVLSVLWALCGAAVTAALWGISMLL